MKNLSLYLIFLWSFAIYSQEQLTLQECYLLVNTNYPLAQQSALLEKQNTVDLSIIATERLPNMNLSAQATYQSDVIEIPIMNAGIEVLNKDQYRASVSVNQLIYGGRSIDASINARSANLKTQQKQIEVNLYQLKKQVNQLFFSVLLLQENSKLLTARKAQLEVKLKEVKSGIRHGTILPTSDKIIEVENLKIQQQLSEAILNKVSLLQTLSSLIGKEIGTTTTLLSGEITTELEAKMNRPELELFQLKKEQIETSVQLISKQTSPKLFGFANGGYGNPGLNMLDNSFQPFYTVGFKLNWNIFDWNATKKQRESLSINKDIIDNELEIFHLKTNIELQEQQSEIGKIEGFISSDLEMIKIRKDIIKAADSQLRNGVITSSAYITELTNLFEDENRLNTHKIQLLLVKANYKITQGQ